MDEPNSGRSDIEKIEAQLPPAMRRFLKWSRRPRVRVFRVPAGILLVIGGFLGFLPILGFWMIPLGLLLLAEDYPPVQRLVRRVLVSSARWWRNLRRRFV